MFREANDSWGPDTGVGTTATGCAAARALASRRHPQLVCDPFAEVLVDAVGIDSFKRLARDLPHGDGDRADIEPTIGFTVARTKFFDDFLIEAGNTSGIRQVVLLASGLDARAYRLRWPAGTVVYDLDQPEITAFKTRALRQAGVSPTAHRKAVGVDLRGYWPAVLIEAGFSPERPTAWIAEGLFGYLPPASESAMLDRITSLSAPGSRFAIEYVDTTDLHGVLRTQSSSSSAELGLTEPPSTLTYDGERPDTRQALTDRGWQCSAVHVSDLRSAYGLADPADPGELVNRFAYVDATWAS